MDLYEIHLSAKYCSGRGVRLRMLSPSDIDRVKANEAKLLDKSAIAVEYMQHVGRGCLRAAIVEVTATGHKAGEALDDWQKIDPLRLEDDFDTLFTAKDHAVLTKVYDRLHAVDGDELEAIVGKVL